MSVQCWWLFGTAQPSQGREAGKEVLSPAKPIPILDPQSWLRMWGICCGFSSLTDVLEAIAEYPFQLDNEEEAIFPFFWFLFWKKDIFSLEDM